MRAAWVCAKITLGAVLVLGTLANLNAHGLGTAASAAEAIGEIVGAGIMLAVGSWLVASGWRSWRRRT